MTKDNEEGDSEPPADYGTTPSSGVWRNARQTLKRAKQEARQTFRSLTWRWPVTRRHHPKAATNATVEWQQPEGVVTNSTSLQPPKGGQSVTFDAVTAPLAKPETAEFAPKPASVAYTDIEQAGNVRGFGTSPKFNHRFTYVDDDDPGIMSESETSATGTAFSRRNGRNKYALNSVNNGQNFAISSSFNVQSCSDKSLGLVFLHYQGETKRALLPDELRSLNDIRNLFIKAFPTVLNADYLQASHVKIYIQDPARQDVFYELDDLREVKDRTVLKLHEQLRPISPVPLSASGTPLGVCPGAVYDTSESLIGLSQSYQASSPLTQTAPSEISAMPRSVDGQDNMNNFNDQEFERSYRLQKCASSSYASSNGYDRRYGTLDSIQRNGGERVRYSSAEPPSKPQRYASPLAHNRGPNGRCSRSPPSSAVVPPPPPIRSSYGTGSESKIEAYATSRGYGNYADGQIYNGGSSDRSSSVSRCGSVTPVIDEEARVRMINMEKQLASLSSLVHSALMAKGVSETVYKDIEMLRREILGPLRDDLSESGSVSRFSDVSSDKGSFSMQDSRDSQFRSTHGKNHNSPSTREYYPSSFLNADLDNNNRLSPEVKSQLKNMKKRVGDMQIDIRHLRRTVQLNAQTSNDILKDVFDRIKMILNTNKHLHLFAAQAQQQNLVETNPLLSDRSWVNQEQERYRNLMRKVEIELGEFEKAIEELRQKVINGERKLRLSEVEAFTESLTHIGRTAANLKTQFPSFQHRMKHVMGIEMEKVVKEEKFLKDEPMRLDCALQRCKKLTSTMLTMKKLALVQDRSAYYNVERERPSSTTPQSTQNMMVPPPPPKPAKSMTSCADAPPLPPPPKNYHQQKQEPVNGKASSESSHVLDTLLEELQTVAKSGNGNGEKRVNFIDQVKHIPIDDNASGSDTIKRSPKASSNVVAGGNYKSSNGPLNGLFDEIVNGNSLERRVENNGKAPSRNSASPSPITASLSGHPDRGHSSTPSSVSSEPPSLGRFAAPPPPPRSSSRTILGNQQPQVRGSYSGTDIDELKKQLMSDINGAINYRSETSGRSGSQTPTAMVQTNAVDIIESSHTVKSASSSDSVNSQDAVRSASPTRNQQKVSSQNNNKELTAKELFFQTQFNNSSDTLNNNSNANFADSEKKQVDGLVNGSQWI